MQLKINKYGSVQELRSTFRQFDFVLVMALNEKGWLGHWFILFGKLWFKIFELGLVFSWVLLSWVWFG